MLLHKWNHQFSQLTTAGQPGGVDEGPGVDTEVDTGVDTGLDTGLDTGVDAAAAGTRAARHVDAGLDAAAAGGIC